MNTVVNPTRDQVKAFCKMVEESLLGAVDRGADIEISGGNITQDLFHLDYGLSPVDVLYVGGKFTASFRERGI